MGHHEGMDTERLQTQVQDAYDHGPDAVSALVATLLSAVVSQVTTLSARVQALEEENAALRARLGTTSHNSGKPPSSDGPEVKPHPRSQRPVTGRRPGGQRGHTGHSVQLRDTPDAVQVHAPVCCGGCGQSLAGVSPQRTERRQVIDLPPIRPQVVEHQAQTVCCPGCGAQTTGEFPAAVGAPVQYGPGVATLAVYLTQEQLLPLARTCAVLAEVFGCPLSEGTVERAVADCHARLAETEAAIKEGVTAAAVAHFDETGVNVGRTLSWLHVASTARLTFYAVHPKRGQEALDALGVLPAFRGRAVHDGWASYWAYDQCTHALCNAHHLRALTFVEEQLGQPWAATLRAVLGEAKRAVDDARALGRGRVPPKVQRAIARRYDAALEEGLRANPPPVPTGQRGRPKRGKAGSLVDRLRTHKEQTLAFLTDPAVPFDNNQAERDIRMTKVREKISGCFRTSEGAQRFCRIRGYIATLRKQGLPLFSLLRRALSGDPFVPVIT